MRRRGRTIGMNKGSYMIGWERMEEEGRRRERKEGKDAEGRGR